MEVMRLRAPRTVVTVPFVEEDRKAIEQEYKQLFPEGTIVFETDREKQMELLMTAQIMCPSTVLRGHFGKGKELVWIQGSGHGIDRYLDPELEASKVVITNCPNSSAVLAEHVFAYMLAFSRRMVESYQAQAQKKWDGSIGGKVFALEGATLGIVGLGHSGQALRAGRERST